MTTILPYDEYWKSLNKIVIGSGAIFLNENNEILILKTTYKEGWNWPGGITEKGESPKTTCEREIKEETGLDIKVKTLLCTDYREIQDESLANESLQMIFDGGTLTQEQIEKIKLDPTEHSEYMFASMEKAETLLHPALAKRLPHVLEALSDNSFFYLENGSPIVE